MKSGVARSEDHSGEIEANQPVKYPRSHTAILTPETEEPHRLSPAGPLRSLASEHHVR
jgi:hypothetical protein